MANLRAGSILNSREAVIACSPMREHGVRNRWNEQSREAATAFPGTVPTMNLRKRHAVTDSPIRNRMLHLRADSDDPPPLFVGTKPG